MKKQIKNKHFYLLRFTGPITEENTSEFLMCFDEARSENNNIVICVNSLGGKSECAFAVYDAIGRSKVNLGTVAEGAVASAAVIVFLAGNERYITPHSFLMLHEPKTSANGFFTDFEHKLREEYLGKIRDFYAGIICERTGQPRKKVLKDIRRGRLICAEEAVKTGYAHKII